MPWSGALTGFCALGAISTYRREAYLRSELLTYASATGLVGLAGWYVNPEASITEAALWLLAFVGGFALVGWWYRSAVQWIDNTHARLTRRSRTARAGRTDVRTVSALLPIPRKPYDPWKFYGDSENEGFFMGMDEFGTPIIWQGRLPHVAVAGMTGSGKGRKLQCLSVQSVCKGELLIYLDPKDDEFGAHVVYTACQRYAKPYHYLRLLPESPPQINLIAGAKAWEIEELLISGLDLGDKGGPSDFYMAKNRKAAREAAQIAGEQGLTLAEVHRQFLTSEYWQEEAPGFVDKLGELAGVAAINAKQGAFTLSDMMASGGAVYVVGSMTLTAVLRAQQMIFVRIQQLATARDRLAGSLKTVCVVADEMRFHISKPVIQGLAASRDKGMRVVLAFQSFTDLKDCPASLNPEMVIGAVIENTPVKLIYKLEDPDTAEWLQRKSGVIQVDDETKVLNRNLALSETTEGERSVRQAEHYLFDTNKLSNLPPGWGVLFGQKLAQACYVSPVPVEKCRAAISPSVAEDGHAESLQLTSRPLDETPRVMPLKQRADDDFFALD